VQWIQLPEKTAFFDLNFRKCGCCQLVHENNDNCVEGAGVWTQAMKVKKSVDIKRVE